MPGVEQALRSGHGLGAAFDIEWRTGPSASVRLSASEPRAARWVAQVLTTAYSSGAWTLSPPVAVRPDPRRRRRFGSKFGPAGTELPDDDPVPWCEAVLPALRAFRSGIVCRWRLRPAGLPVPSTLAASPGAPEYLAPGYRTAPPTEVYRSSQDRWERNRRSPRWVARVWIESEEGANRSGELARFEHLVEAASARPGSARLHFRDPWPVVRADPPVLLVSEGEVAGLLPGPESRFLPGPQDPNPADLVLDLGSDPAGGRVAIPIEPRQGRHAVILGETGMGKSSLLVSLAVAAVRHGNVVLFDPIGDSGRAFLARLPPARRSDTIWVSPAESPVSIDLLESLRSADRHPEARDRALSDVVNALRRVRAGRFPDTPFWGPRIEETVRRALSATAAIPRASLADAVRLLSHGVRRPVGIPVEARAAVESLAERVRERPEEVEGSRRLLAELIDRPTLLALLGDSRAHFRVRDEFVPGRITVITGDASTIGESAARYLLAVHLALFWSERLACPAAPKTFLVLDEAQWYVHESLGEILRLGRRENVHVMLATQGLGALPKELREAIQTNVADLIAFRGAPEDARELSRIAPWIGVHDVLAQPRGHALALIGKGVHVQRLIRPVPRALDPQAVRERLEAVRSARPDERSPDPEIDVVVDEASGPRPPPDEQDRAARSMLLAIWGELLEVPEDSTVEVGLDRLRQAFDPRGEALRTVGRRLKDAGALRQTLRSPGGSRWEVARAGVAELLDSGVDPTELRSATERYRAAL